MYGPDAVALLEAVRPVIERADCIEGAVAFLQYGEGREARTARVPL